MRELDCNGSMAGNRPSPARLRDRTMDAERCEKAWTAAGSVKSSAGTYTAWMEVMAPVSVLAMRSSRPESSVPMVGWYPIRDGICPMSPDTSEPAWMNRKMLSIRSRTSRCSSSRKYSANVSAAWPTRNRLPGGSFIWPKTIAMWGSTPASRISLWSSSPSRHRSPMPQKMLTPSWWPTMLWIISVSSTVFPTPAPPKSPAFPPRSRGTRTSTTLMPVSKISDFVERFSRGGGAWWTDRHWTSASAGPRSIVLPNTSSMRERTAWPTGVFRGPPVSSTGIPRASPWVGVRAIPRTWCGSVCVRTSIAIPLSFPMRRRLRTGGSRPSKRTSTTLPRTAETTPALSVPDVTSVRPARNDGSIPGRRMHGRPPGSGSRRPDSGPPSATCVSCHSSLLPSRPSPTSKIRPSPFRSGRGRTSYPRSRPSAGAPEGRCSGMSRRATPIRLSAIP